MATESWDLHHLMHRARKLLRAEGASRAGTRTEAPGIVERIRHFATIWKRYQAAVERYPEGDTSPAARRRQVRQAPERVADRGLRAGWQGLGRFASPRLLAGARVPRRVLCPATVSGPRGRREPGASLAGPGLQQGRIDTLQGRSHPQDPWRSDSFSSYLVAGGVAGGMGRGGPWPISTRRFPMHRC